MKSLISTKGFVINPVNWHVNIDDYSLEKKVLDVNTLITNIYSNAGKSIFANWGNRFAEKFQISSILKHFGYEEKLSKEELERRAVEEILGRFAVNDWKTNNKNKNKNTSTNANTNTDTNINSNNRHQRKRRV